MRVWIATLPVALMAVATHAVAEIPTIQSNAANVEIRDSSPSGGGGWILAPEANPDVYRTDLIDGKSNRVTFVTDVDSISFTVELGQTHDFIIQWGDQPCHTRVVGQAFIPAAVFDPVFRSENRGKILVEIPEVYELVNVAIAMTSFGQSRSSFVYHDSPYYARVLEWFGPHTNHPFVTTLDSLLTDNSGRYARIKMNGRAFRFDENDQIMPSSVYDRTGFRGDRTNRLQAHVEKMRSFADATDFRGFYRENASTYDAQIAFYEDTADLLEMKRWLDGQFPGSSDYDLYRIVFSPLVSYNQSSTWFESNGFRELQPHVNYPYPEDVNRSGDMSPLAETIYRGNIVFTEINHGYINPEGDKYADEIRDATSDRDRWVDADQSANYYGGNSAFHEYMNWGLVVLRIMDYVPETEQEPLITRVELMMVNRHFPEFRQFNRFLMEAYAGRGPNVTVADLYPEIVEWFARNN